MPTPIPMPTKESCSKKRFATEDAAQQFIVRSGANKDYSAYVPIRAYFHYDCHAWHVTSQPLRELTPAQRNRDLARLATQKQRNLRDEERRSERRKSRRGGRTK